VLSLAVFGYGAFVLAGSSAAGAAFILSGALGLVTSYFCHLAYTGRRTSLVDLAKQSAS
jgi:hypothetical protein